jgi:hypothetical protein
MVYQVPESSVEYVAFKAGPTHGESVHAHVGSIAANPKEDGRVLSALIKRGVYTSKNRTGINGSFTAGQKKTTAPFFSAPVQRGLQAETLERVQSPQEPSPDINFLKRQYETRTPLTPLRYYR